MVIVISSSREAGRRNRQVPHALPYCKIKPRCHSRTRMDISIVGGGPAGLVAAIAARQAGFDCVVYEQAPSFARVGGAVGIQGNGLAVLDAIGVLDRFRPHVETLTRVTVEAPAGRVISVADFRELALPHRGFGVALRYDLQETLLA